MHEFEGPTFTTGLMVGIASGIVIVLVLNVLWKRFGLEWLIVLALIFLYLLAARAFRRPNLTRKDAGEGDENTSPPPLPRRAPDPKTLTAVAPTHPDREDPSCRHGPPSCPS